MSYTVANLLIVNYKGLIFLDVRQWTLSECDSGFHHFEHRTCPQFPFLIASRNDRLMKVSLWKFIS